MEKKKQSILTNDAGFYGAMAVCLLVVGIGGYSLLAGGRSAPAKTAVETAPRVTAPAVEPAELPAVETAAPEPIAVPQPEEAPRPIAVTPPVIIPTVELDDTPVAAQAPRLVVQPLEGEVVSAFSVDKLTYNETLADWRIHDGVDIAAGEGTPVLAAGAGTVAAVTDDALMGTTVVLRHEDGYQTTYANLRPETRVEVGQAVSAGQVIGAVGTTAAAESAQGPHLHFAVTWDGDVVDPEEFLK